MKRLIISIIGGVAFPVIYFAFAFFIIYLFPNHFADTTLVYGKPAPGLILAPILGTIYLSYWLEYHHFFGFQFLFDTVWFRLSLMVILPIGFYSTATYLVLTLFGVPQRPGIEGVQKPPLPQEFDV